MPTAPTALSFSATVCSSALLDALLQDWQDRYPQYMSGDVRQPVTVPAQQICGPGAAGAAALQRLSERLLAEAEAGALTVHLDLQGVTLFDSIALGQLLTVSKRLRLAGTNLVLAGIEPALREVLQLTHLDQVFTIHEASP